MSCQYHSSLQITDWLSAEEAVAVLTPAPACPQLQLRVRSVEQEGTAGGGGSVERRPPSVTVPAGLASDQRPHRYRLLLAPDTDTVRLLIDDQVRLFPLPDDQVSLPDYKSACFFQQKNLTF